MINRRQKQNNNNNNKSLHKSRWIKINTKLNRFHFVCICVSFFFGKRSKPRKKCVASWSKRTSKRNIKNCYRSEHAEYFNLCDKWPKQTTHKRQHIVIIENSRQYIIIEHNDAEFVYIIDIVKCKWIEIFAKAAFSWKITTHKTNRKKTQTEATIFHWIFKSLHVCIFAVSSWTHVFWHAYFFLPVAANTVAMNAIIKKKHQHHRYRQQNHTLDSHTKSLFRSKKRIQWQRCVYKIEIDKNAINNK